jgi:hypothetical protein
MDAISSGGREKSKSDVFKSKVGEKGKHRLGKFGFRNPIKLSESGAYAIHIGL